MKNIISWVLRLLAAVILWQTLYFKFTAAPESVALFTKLGVEPWGRIGTGIVELFAGLFLLIPSTVFIGAMLGIGLMSGAILSHLLVIGIASQGDGGYLFALAVVVLICSCCLAWLYKNQGIRLYQRLFTKH